MDKPTLLCHPEFADRAFSTDCSWRREGIFLMAPFQRIKSGCRRALTAGWLFWKLAARRSMPREAAVVVLEDDPVFDADFSSRVSISMD